MILYTHDNTQRQDVSHIYQIVDFKLGNSPAHDPAYEARKVLDDVAQDSCGVMQWRHMLYVPGTLYQGLVRLYEMDAQEAKKAIYDLFDIHWTMINTNSPHYAKFHNSVMKSISRAVRRSALLDNVVGYKYPIIVPEEYSREDAIDIAKEILSTKFSDCTNVRIDHDPHQYAFFFIVVN